VRFSQLLNFEETSDFSAPIAARRTVLIQVEHASPIGANLRQQAFPELTLSVEGGTAATAHTFPMGFARWGVVIDDPGSYRLVAKRDGTALDSLSLTVGAIATVRLADRVSVTTHSVNASGPACASVEDTTLDQVTLRRNQTVQLIAVPLDGDGKAMVGLLSVTAKTSSPAVKLDLPLLMEGGTPNALLLSPGATLGATVDVTVHEEGAPELTVTLPTADEDAPITCH